MACFQLASTWASLAPTAFPQNIDELLHENFRLIFKHTDDHAATHQTVVHTRVQNFGPNTHADGTVSFSRP